MLWPFPPLSPFEAVLQPPGRSDLGSVPRLEPTDRRVIDVVGKRDLAQRLAFFHAFQGFARLMLGQLRLAAEPCALGHRARGLRWSAAGSDRARTQRFRT